MEDSSGVWSIKFFRIRILPLSVDRILEESTKLQNQQKEYKSELFKICWYMRGGITIDEAYNLSYEDKTLIGDIIKENLDTTKKSGLPFF